MRKAKPILLLSAFLFATLGGCFGPLMAATHSMMDCCTSMPCNNARPSQSCCTPELPGPAGQVQQAAEVTAPTVSFAILATLPHPSTAPIATTAAHIEVGFHSYSPPGELYTIHHSFLI